LLEGEISNPYEYDCLNGCIYRRLDGNPDVKYCFKEGNLTVECGLGPGEFYLRERFKIF